MRERRSLPSFGLLLVRSAPWTAAFAVLGLVLFVLVRSCGYQTGPAYAYAAYFALHVVLPGVVALHAINRGPVSLTMAVALGVPTGYAIEIFSFLGLAALGAREAVAGLPLLWTAGGMLLCLRRREWPLRFRWTLRHGGLALALAGLFLCTVASATTQMFAESPLVAGLPQRPIFHDWMYLVSRAAAIKHHWPLEDPGLAGAPLQYHYFMLVHVALAAWITELEVTLVLVRLSIVPLGAVLVAQAFALGRLLSRSAWGGVMAVLMTVAASELSFSPHYGQPMFLGLFTRWVYVSPTFYFGVIFFGALLLAVARLSGSARLGVWHLVWVGGLAAAGTGAKGTVLPVLLVAIAIWAAWTWARERRVPRRLALLGVLMSGGFLAVYFTTMTAWGTGDASFEPFRVLQLTSFWKTNAAVWERALAGWLPASIAGNLALVACGAVVFVGTTGVRLLALAPLAVGETADRRALARWLTAAFVSATAMGLLIHLDSYSELYVLLLIPLPMSVLAAAIIVGAGRRWRSRPAASREQSDPLAPRAGIPRQVPVARRLGRTAFAALAATGIGLAFAFQCGLWVARRHPGFGEWLRQTPHMRVRDEMVTLREAMLWIRHRTEPDAILVANAFTPKHLQRGRGDLVDHTTAGVHFYYSALSERRLFVEGPTYLQDPARALRRMERAAEIFYGDRVPLTSLPGAAPGYAIIDRSLNDGARIALPERHRVYTNARFEIYRLPRKGPLPRDAGSVASLSDE